MKTPTNKEIYEEISRANSRHNNLKESFEEYKEEHAANAETPEERNANSRRAYFLGLAFIALTAFCVFEVWALPILVRC
jgi:ferric-dicitrate binding protein FerR (iron transport regulator)